MFPFFHYRSLVLVLGMSVFWCYFYIISISYKVYTICDLVMRYISSVCAGVVIIARWGTLFTYLPFFMRDFASFALLFIFHVLFCFFLLQNGL